jgi:hypothetical protein
MERKKLLAGNSAGGWHRLFWWHHCNVTPTSERDDEEVQPQRDARGAGRVARRHRTTHKSPQTRAHQCKNTPRTAQTTPRRV